ncbi:MAG: hypothetical protein M3478_13755 [Planctomycetota bacterium]|nr:hypothetical protein [Planctomycetota bacterium]
MLHHSPKLGSFCCFCFLVARVAMAEPIEGFQPTGFLEEQQKTWKTEDGVRILLNASGDFTPSRPTHLVLFALPNGNTIEWTLGAKLEPGTDWHYDIQHVGAQVRKLRQVTPEENIVVALLEADTKSWPAWRKAHPDNPKRIRALVDELSRAVPGPDANETLTLTCHSGGGSFIFGYINGGDTIPDNVARIAFLDANYGYADDEQHGEKLLAWLKGDAKRTLVVIAYDDRDVKLNGKNIVSPTGGTYRASHRMIERLKKDVKLEASKRGPFESHTDGLQTHFLIHTNPQAKILHTVLVERNGLLEALTIGTPQDVKWGGMLMGDRAYSPELIQPAPAPAPARPATTRVVGIPPRPANAPGGRAFAEQVANLPPQAREAAIFREITRGNVPRFLRQFEAVTVPFTAADGTKHSATYEVSVDYLAVGSDDDFFRVPMTPATASRIADAFGCTLPTRKIVDDVYSRAEAKFEPKPMGAPRETVERFLEHHAIIEAQRAGESLYQLVAGHKKDVVITNRLKEKANKVAIYGWHKLDGKPIQPLYVGHVDWYVDYSHGIRLVKGEMTVDGKRVDVADVMKDPNLSAAISDEGPIDAKYP